jgi:hypothetical protein
MMIRRFFILVSFFVCGFFVTAQAQEVHFFSGLSDIPLMQGLDELPEQGVHFDKPDGRVVEAVALMDSLTEQGVSAYYLNALPQFGWARIAENEYRRQGEKLRLSFEENEGHQFLKILISPR